LSTTRSGTRPTGACQLDQIARHASNPPGIGGRPTETGTMVQRVVGGPAEDVTDDPGLTRPGPAAAVVARDRLAAWWALLDRPLTSYYLIIGITALLLGLGLVMVLSTSSVQDLAEGLPAYSDFKKQLAGALIGLPVMYLAARTSPRLFRAAAYPLLGVSILGLLLTLIPSVGRSAYGASRWIAVGPLQLQ